MKQLAEGLYHIQTDRMHGLFAHFVDERGRSCWTRLGSKKIVRARKFTKTYGKILKLEVR